MRTIPRPETEPAPPIDSGTYREVLGHYPTGVAVVTGFHDDRPVGMVVGTFSSVSLDPPLVAFMPAKSSGTYARLAEATSYCINVLAHDQLALCRTMATPSDHKFDHVTWSTSEHGAPALDDVVARIDCAPQSRVEAGDHWIVLCSVTAMEVTRPVTPLLFFQGGYGAFSLGGMSAQADTDLIAAIRLGDVAAPHVERLARRIGCEVGALVGIGPDELTTVVSAVGDCAVMVEPLGERIPLIPPIGEAYVAGADPAVVEHWLSKAHPADADVIAGYRGRLARVERDGVDLVVVSSHQREDYERMRAALREYSNGHLTPARERALRAEIAGYAHLYEDVELADAETYDVANAVAPVHNPDGEVFMVLRLTQLPAGVKGTVVREWVQGLKRTAADIERELQTGSGPERLHDYREWLYSDFPV